MSGAAIEPGMWMEALRDERPYYAKGSLWRVDRVWPQGPTDHCMRDDTCNAPAVIFAGMRMPAGVHAACACGFRPIYKPNATLIEQLKQPAPEREPIDA